jgi:four helix bundle protein
MASIERFEDVPAWQKGRQLKQAVYAFSRKGSFASDFALRDQIRRACISVTAIIAEGFERGGKNEFIQFLGHAKGSCGEVRDHLYTALDEHYIGQKEFDELYATSVEVSRLISGFITYLQESTVRGVRFKGRSDARSML